MAGLSLFGASPGDGGAGSQEVPGDAPQCSAKGCRADAVWALRWNNPSLHPPERRKTWAACEEHLEHLSAFLSMRGFLRETERLPA
ncbi:hypothetical protein [Agilicoccus flavus]|uniref:hypothetical protein n=1 Tax=Agilicoccus flavus TaxID=2775968 RepID=UPI0021F67607|nr:hypothetical protein [Agilicoccus flavus]